MAWTEYLRKFFCLLGFIMLHRNWNSTAVFFKLEIRFCGSSIKLPFYHCTFLLFDSFLNFCFFVLACLNVNLLYSFIRSFFLSYLWNYVKVYSCMHVWIYSLFILSANSVPVNCFRNVWLIDCSKIHDYTFLNP